MQTIQGLAFESPSRKILEIGPGAGGLTLTLLEQGAEVLAVELDRRVNPLMDVLKARFPGQLEVIYGDALEVSWAALIKDRGWEQVTLVGNLPYYITAPLLGRLVDEPFLWQRAVVMVQREVAGRLLAEPGERVSSTLGVLLRYVADFKPGIDKVAPDSFYPSPDVFSSVIQLIPHQVLPVDWESFRWVVRAGFQHRRKTMRQSLSRGTGSPFSRDEWGHLLESVEISPRARAESLTLNQWIRLTEEMDRRKRGGCLDVRKPDQRADEL